MNPRIRRGAIPSIFVRREDYERVSQSKVSKKLKKKDHESSETTFKIVEKVLLTYFHWRMFVYWWMFNTNCSEISI